MRFKNYLICLFDFYSNRRVTWCHQCADRFVYFFCIARVCLFFDFFPNRRRHCLVVWRPFRRIGRPIHARIFDERRRLHAAEKKRLRLEKKMSNFLLFVLSFRRFRRKNKWTFSGFLFDLFWTFKTLSHKAHIQIQLFNFFFKITN